LRAKAARLTHHIFSSGDHFSSVIAHFSLIIFPRPPFVMVRGSGVQALACSGAMQPAIWQSIFVRSPGSTRILFTAKTRRREEILCDSSCLRGEIFLVAAQLLCVYLCSSVVSFCAV